MRILAAANSRDKPCRTPGRHRRTSAELRGNLVDFVPGAADEL
jgi:hypothetical protein